MKIWINIFILFLAIGLVACGSKKPLNQSKLAPKDLDELARALDSINQTDFSFFSSRIDTKYADNKQNINFKTSLKIQKDSAIHSLISYAGIPVITAMITQDSVKISNKKDKCYLLENLVFFKNQFGIEFSYSDLEQLLIGKPILFDKSQTYYKVEDPYHYGISTQANKQDEGKLLITYYLTDDLKHLKRTEITSFKDKTNIAIFYADHLTDLEFASPKNVKIAISSPKKEISANLNYEKVEINTPKELTIVIPDSYERCK